MANLVELFDNIVQMQNLNGVPLAAGKLYVYALGRTRLMDSWSDVDGESLNPNPIILDDAGQAHVYVSDDFDYTLVVCDQYNNEIFSLDKYLYSEGSHSHADVAVAPSEHIGVSSYHVGEVTVYVPYLTGEVGKTYEGIDPIVVNNTLNRISANHIPLGVQDPLYFVEDSESACIIGMSGGIVPEGTMVESSLGFENNKITGYNGSAFSAGNEYEAGNYISIDNNVINVTGLSPVPADTASTGLVAEVSADIISQIPSTAGLATTAQLDEKLDKVDSANFYPMTGNPSGFLTAHQSLQGYATEQWVEGKGYLTSVNIPESATWNATTQTVSANSAQWAGGTANPQIPVTSTSGISIFESGDKVYFNISADYTLNSDLQSVSAEITGMIPAPFDPTYLSGQIDTKLDSAIYATASGTFLTALPQDLVYTADIQDMATTGQVAEKLDTTAFSTVSGDFLTAVDLTPYQEKADMTAYATVESLTAKQDAGDYLSATDSANFLLTSDSGNFYPSDNPSAFITGVDLTPYQTVEGMTAYQPVGNYQTAGDYLTTADSATFYTTANESGFISEVPDTYLQNTDLTITDNKVTEISGIPLSAGTELEFEYDAADNISAINSSAISTTPAQALYAQNPLYFSATGTSSYMGINSADLARILGVDETVLYSGDGTLTTAFTISEPLSGFERLRIYVHAASDGEIFEHIEEQAPPTGNYISYTHNYTIPNAYICQCFLGYLANGLTFSNIVTRRNFWSPTGATINVVTSTDNNNLRANGWVYKIVGIGRKEV